MTNGMQKMCIRDSTIKMSYDAANRITDYIDEAGVVTRYEYDSMGRMTKASDTAGNLSLIHIQMCIRDRVILVWAANTTCIYCTYQDKAPEGLDRFKKK